MSHESQSALKSYLQQLDLDFQALFQKNKQLLTLNNELEIQNEQLQQLNNTLQTQVKQLHDLLNKSN